MKKRKLALTGLIGFAFLFGCNQIEPTNEVKAGLPSGFEVVTEGEIGGRATQFVIKNIETGCHYLFVDHWDATAITQMFIEKDGLSVPYCENRGE